MIRATVTAALLFVSAPAMAQPLRCDWTEKSQCNPGKGCQSMSAGSNYVTADAATRDYQRCDRQGCDAYTASVSRSGIYTIFDLTGRGMFLKLANDGTATEVVSLGNTILVSQGICR